MQTKHIKARTLGNNWVEGTINEYRFQAKVYNNDSKFGIEDGRISKLVVWDKDYRKAGQGYDPIIFYDRGWDMYPSSPEHEEILQALLEYFANSPTSKY
jgi:hypothetical protein